MTGDDAVLILYGTRAGHARRVALKLQAELHRAGKISSMRSMAKFDPEDLVSHGRVLAVMSTDSGGMPPPDARFFCQWLRDAVEDVRVPGDYLSGTRFAVFGLGDRAYEEQFNLAALNLDESFLKLRGRQLTAPFLSDGTDDDGDVSRWVKAVCIALDDAADGTAAADEAADDVVDVEDMGSMMSTPTEGPGGRRPEMVTSRVRSNLAKQGYKIIGSHSGVKICRWTKAQLRGRGGCYKHTFYGINSYQCMEMTPSLACANKCVFCWRHQTNPVGTSWRWAMDDPREILDGAIDRHCRMINEMKGVPGVLPDRLAEAYTVRHCALSLVPGETDAQYDHAAILVTYRWSQQEINTLLGMMHERKISTFLVTNAQFPDLIQTLRPVTQLYVSIDAADKDTLKAVDRPLFGDYWDRFLGSLDAIRESKQRTVFRLTLLKGYNMDDVARYAQLVARGAPCFIEVKGVTFCGAGETSELTMKSVPFHHEVKSFCEALCREIGDDQYDLACEHEHSCCVVIGHTKFKVDGVWHTWIDYDRFHELSQSGDAFSPTDYACPTPSWAIYNNDEKGFDPNDTRHYRNRHRARPTERDTDGAAVFTPSPSTRPA
ncbi:hypothetical protein PBRA_003804 [Plasmodiophora brassicae]|uniref:tRNA 4-demethylwyosine synthase (AdoMet-dependent) n=1 Tax=Plasmodiophora brassicae TaxID=37360 RepID=A0A0G4IID2_PLABS|nr:hypothetical protein PBRA_003804 [Plasmodiophora brassicae]